MLGQVVGVVNEDNKTAIFYVYNEVDDEKYMASFDLEVYREVTQELLKGSGLDWSVFSEATSARLYLAGSGLVFFLIDGNWYVYLPDNVSGSGSGSNSASLVNIPRNDNYEFDVSDFEDAFIIETEAGSETGSGS